MIEISDLGEIDLPFLRGMLCAVLAWREGAELSPRVFSRPAEAGRGGETSGRS